MTQFHFHIRINKPVYNSVPYLNLFKVADDYSKRDLLRLFNPVATIMFFCLFFLPFSSIEAHYLEGKIVCSQSGLPLDSVRVGSRLYQTVAVSQRDGRFVLDRTTGIDCPPETISIDSLDKFTLHITSPKQLKTFILHEDGPVAATIFDLQGHAVAQTSLNKSKCTFTNVSMSSGIYIFKAAGLPPRKFLDIGNITHSRINWKPQTIINIAYPQYSSFDTIYFCKEGYSVFAATCNYRIKMAPEQVL
jgi:hypothetical protein